MVPKVFKKSDLNSISIKLGVLYFLNITDLLITDFLLQTGMFVEVNKIMSYIISDKFASILIKIVLPLILLLILRYRLAGASSSQISKGNTIINIGLLFYFVVNVFHFIWVITYYILI